jgi:multiple sugar transport system permease protein
MIPREVTIIPRSLMFSAAGLTNTLWPLVLPAWFGYAFFIFLLRQFFMGIPLDLDHAARIDGATEFEVFLKIAMPLATPVIALVGFFNFTGNWNNYFLPYVTLPGKKAPIQVGLAELLSNVPAFNPTNAASTTISLSALALATLIAIAPVMIVFLFCQRFLVSGMTAGGTKE